MQKDINTTISLVIPERLKNAVTKEASKQERTFSNLLRKVLLEKFKV